MIIASKSTVPSVLLSAFDLTSQARILGTQFIGGFQTILEQDCLEILLRGTQPVTICPARSVESVCTLYKGPLWTAVRKGMEEGRVTLESPFPDTVHRATKQTAIVRNTWLVERADAVLILHATPGGETERVARLAIESGKPLATLDHPANQHLIDLGAYPTSASDPLLTTPERWSIV